MPARLSTYLDLVRLLAAVVVFCAHANYERLTGGLPGLWRLSQFSNDAVMVFFTLSGFVIAHVVASQQTTGVEYLIARVARLWSVGLVAVALTVVLDGLGQQLTPALYDGWWYQGSDPWRRTIVNLLFLNEIWFSSTRLFSNGPYWSIGYEFWYYAIFGAAVYLRGCRRWLCLALLLAFVGPKILLLLPVWLAGVWAYRTPLAARLQGWRAVFIFAASLSSVFALRLIGTLDQLDAVVARALGEQVLNEQLTWSRHFLANYCVGALVALNFVAARALAARRPEVDSRAQHRIRTLAAFTFPLYLLHYPLLQFFSALSDAAGWVELRRHGVVFGTLAVVLLIGQWAERQKTPLKQWLLSLRHRPRATGMLALVLRLLVAAALGQQAMQQLLALDAGPVGWLPTPSFLSVPLVYAWALVELVASLLLVTGSFARPICGIAGLAFAANAVWPGPSPEPLTTCGLLVLASASAWVGAGSAAWHLEDLTAIEDDGPRDLI